MRTLPLPRAVTIEARILERLQSITEEAGLSGSRIALVAGERGQARFDAAGGPPDTWSRLSPEGGRVEDAERVAETVKGEGLEAIVAVGGGRTIDVGKFGAALANVPFVSVATNLAHDGIASPVAVLERDGHRHSLAAVMPEVVAVDMSEVAKDGRAWRAGVGDIVSNVCAVNDWQLASRETGEPVDGLALAMAVTAAEAVLYNPEASGSPAFLLNLARSLIMSGIAMAIAGSSRPSSGGDHEISHAIDSLFPGDRLHGEQAAVGAVFCEFVRESSSLPAMVGCFRRHGVPCLPAEIGLSDEEFVAAVMDAPATRPDRYTVLEHLNMTGPRIADELRRLREAID